MRKNTSLRAELDIVDVPHEYKIIFEAETKLTSQVVEIDEIVEVFVAAANVGMFSIDPAVDKKTIQIESTGSHREGMIRYVWNVAGIDVGAYHVLLNMLEVANNLSEHLHWIRLISTYDYRKRLNRNDILCIPFPSKAKALPFILQCNGNLADKKEPVIRLTFRRDISDDELIMVTRLFIIWDNLVIRGGYLEDSADMDTKLGVEEKLSSQQTYLAASCTIEHLLYEFFGHEAAFNALINMACRLHYIFCPLVSIEFE